MSGAPSTMSGGHPVPPGLVVNAEGPNGQPQTSSYGGDQWPHEPDGQMGASAPSASQHTNPPNLDNADALQLQSLDASEMSQLIQQGGGPHQMMIRHQSQQHPMFNAWLLAGLNMMEDAQMQFMASTVAQQSAIAPTVATPTAEPTASHQTSMAPSSVGRRRSSSRRRRQAPQALLQQAAMQNTESVYSGAGSPQVATDWPTFIMSLSDTGVISILRQFWSKLRVDYDRSHTDPDSQDQGDLQSRWAWIDTSDVMPCLELALSGPVDQEGRLGASRRDVYRPYYDPMGLWEPAEDQTQGWDPDKPAQCCIPVPNETPRVIPYVPVDRPTPDDKMNVAFCRVCGHVERRKDITRHIKKRHKELFAMPSTPTSACSITGQGSSQPSGQ